MSCEESVDVLAEACLVEGLENNVFKKGESTNMEINPKTYF